MLGDLKLATVCQEARCPNMGECWSGGTATIMLMGEVCTRGCKFCNVKTGNPKGVLDPLEPEKVAYSISQMSLEYIVLTSVDRDDLPDQGSSHFARTIRTIKKLDSHVIVEVLTPDFRGDRELVQVLVESKPDVFAHNVETVERLQKSVRDPRAGYHQSLDVLKTVKEIDPTRYTKTSLMLGLGERDEEIVQTLKDLRSINCDVVTFGQYLQPTPRHLNVVEYVTPEKFKYWQEVAEGMGFLYVASGPLVRSSYRAGEFFMKGMIAKQRLETVEKQRSQIIEKQSSEEKEG
jgi:lipoic acid synthetase